MDDPHRSVAPPGFRRFGRGRADLLYLLVREGREVLDRSAHVLGYQASEPEPPDKQISDHSAAETRFGSPTIEARPPKKRVGGMRFIRLHKRRPAEVEHSSIELPERLRRAKPFLEPDLPDPNWFPPPIPPLAPWRRLWPFLRAVLGTEGFSHRLDLPRLVDSLARGQGLRRLPRLRRAGWSPVAQLLLDLDLRLYPFWEDFYRLVDQLLDLRGKSGLDILCFGDGPDGPCRRWRPGADSMPCIYRLPEAGTPLLVLSDLGQLDGLTDPWRDFGRRLRAAGLNPVVLLPCPERYWSADLTDLYVPVVWDRGRRLPRRLGGASMRSTGISDARPDPSEELGVARMLRLLACAVRVEPALLRAVRHLLPSHDADVGSEAALWRHADVRDDGPTWVVRPERQDAYRDAAVRDEPEELRNDAQALVRLWHLGLSSAIRHEEELIRAHAEGDAPAPETRDFLWNAAATLFREPDAYGYLGHLKTWILRLAVRQHQRTWRSDYADPIAAALAKVLLERADDGSELPFPPGFDLNRVLWAVPRTDRPRLYLLRQEQRMLRLEAADEIEAGGNLDTAAAVVAKLHMVTNLLQWQRLSGGKPVGSVQVFDIKKDRAIPVPENGGLLIQGNFEELEIDGLERPSWAGIQQAGARLELLPADDPDRPLCWLPPGDYEIRAASGRVFDRYGLRQGAFVGQDEYDRLATRGFEQPDWADSFGLDGVGLWADLRYADIIQRFRWIAPGEFLMGSPADEPERQDNETQHQVILPRGFWLADTACTLALWQAVMGNNPSRFKDMEHPVENVSWEKARAFIERLNQERPGLDLRLPSEAEWEYACRAATTTPFWFGETISTEQANYDGNYPYAGGAKGEYRQETLEVKALPANAWGLYQMHGNVREWCQDWYGDYPEDLVRDPQGPDAGADRVQRGGCWVSLARRLRSAYRYRRLPDFRDNNTGFRLARGRTEPQAGTAGKG